MSEKAKTSRIKKVIRTLIILLIIVAIGLYIVGLGIGTIVKTGVETIVPKVTGTSVELDSCFVSLTGGSVTIKNFAIGNPEGFDTDYAFKLDKLTLDIAPRSLLTDIIVIEEFSIDGIHVTYEQALAKSNISTIKENIEKLTKSNSKATPAAKEDKPEESAKKDKKIQVNLLDIRNGTVSVSTTFLKGQKISIPLPPIHMVNIGKDRGGVDGAELVSEILDAISVAVIDAVKNSDETTQGIMKGVKKSSSEMAKDIKKTSSDLADEVKEKSSELINDVKGLFK